MKKNGMPRSLIVIVGVILVAAVAIVAQAQSVSIGDILGAASRPIQGGDAVIATINAAPVSLNTLERTKTVLQASSQTPLDDSEAYRQAMDQIVRNAVLIQEARSKGPHSERAGSTRIPGADQSYC